MSSGSASTIARFNAAVFDLDGTLLDSAPSLARTLNAMRLEKGLPPTAVASYRRWISLGASELVRRALEVDIEAVPENLAVFRKRYRAMPTPSDCLYPCAAEILKALRDRGRRLAICSNKPTVLCQKILDELNLSPHFDAIIGSDPGRPAKPHRDPLDRALLQIRTRSDESLFIGDSSIDQRTAEACGVPFVFFAAGYDDGVRRESAFYIIDRLDEILRLFP